MQDECNQACLNCWAAADDVNKSPMEHLAQGKRSGTLGGSHSRVSAPCKGKSFNPLCCYSCLIADLAVLKWNTVCIFCSILAPCLKAFALTGRDCSNTWYPGCRFACPGLCAPLGFYWHHRLRLSNSSKLDCIRLARWFSPPLLNPKLQAYSLSFVFFYFGCKGRANVESGQSL